MNRLFELLSAEVARFWNQIRDRGGDGETAFLPLLRPVAPYDGPFLQSTLTTLGVLFALVATSGVALAALGVLLVAMLALWLLLTEVLGITIEVAPFRA